MRKVNISLGSPDILCSLCAELISSAGSCSVHMPRGPRDLLKGLCLSLDKVEIPLFCKVHI